MLDVNGKPHNRLVPQKVFMDQIVQTNISSLTLLLTHSPISWMRMCVIARQTYSHTYIDLRK